MKFERKEEEGRGSRKYADHERERERALLLYVSSYGGCTNVVTYMLRVCVSRLSQA